MTKSKSKKLTKNFNLLITFCVVSVILGLIGLIIVKNSTSKTDSNTAQSKSSPTPRVLSQTIDDSNWEARSYYNLNFNIPASWNTDKTGRGGDGPFALRIFNNTTLSGYLFVIEILENRSLTSFNHIEPVVSTNKEGNKYISSTFRSQPSGGGSRKDYYIENGKDVYHFSTSGNLTDEELKYFDKIFSTFKFIN